MTILEGLLGEHAVLRALTDELEADVARPLEESILKARVGLLKPVLLSHALLEEDLLLRPLEPVLRGHGPLEVIRAEHRLIEDLLYALLNRDHHDIDRGFVAVQQAKGLPATYDAVQELVALVSDHFSKEEQVLFPAARSTLTDRELRRLGAEWAQRRGIHVPTVPDGGRGVP